MHLVHRKTSGNFSSASSTIDGSLRQFVLILCRLPVGSRGNHLPSSLGVHQRPDDCRGINVMKEKQLQFDFLLYRDSIKVASGIGQFAHMEAIFW